MGKFYKVQDSIEEIFVKLTKVELQIQNIKGHIQNSGVITGKELNEFFTRFETARKSLTIIEAEAQSYFKRNEISEDVVPIFMEQLAQRFGTVPTAQIKKPVTDISLSAGEDDDLPF